jgi:hypothetical protein
MHSNQKQHELLTTDSFKSKLNKATLKKQTFDPIETEQSRASSNKCYNQSNLNVNNLLSSSHSRSLNSINKKNTAATDLVQPLLVNCSDTKETKYNKPNQKTSYDNLGNDKLRSESLITFNEKTDKYSSPSIIKK